MPYTYYYTAPSRSHSRHHDYRLHEHKPSRHQQVVHTRGRSTHRDDRYDGRPRHHAHSHHHRDDDRGRSLYRYAEHSRPRYQTPSRSRPPTPRANPRKTWGYAGDYVGDLERFSRDFPDHRNHRESGGQFIARGVAWGARAGFDKATGGAGKYVLGAVAGGVGLLGRLTLAVLDPGGEREWRDLERRAQSRHRHRSHGRSRHR